MTRLLTGALVLAVAISGCKRPPEAPRKLDDLSQYLYKEWDNEDPEVLAVGLRNLQNFLGDVDLETNAVLDRSWELSPLAQDIANEVEHPGLKSADTLGVAVAGISVWPPSDHARLQAESDQTITEPSAASYSRTFPNDEDGCFPDRSCDQMVTISTVERNNLVMSVIGELDKDYRWVEIEEGEWAFISRSWIPESWLGDAEKSKVWQSFSIDVWIPSGKKGTLRYQTLWSESEVANASDTIIIGTVKDSTDKIYKAGDEAIEELYH